MTMASDLELRQSDVTWFDGETADCAGQPLKMYSVVTPTEAVEQYFAYNEKPIVVPPGVRLLVLGAAKGDKNFLWLEVDDRTSAFAMAEVCMAASKLRYLCEVGDGLSTKRLPE